MLDYILGGGGGDAKDRNTRDIEHSIHHFFFSSIVFQIDHHVTEDCPKTKMDCDFLKIGCNHVVRILLYSI